MGTGASVGAVAIFDELKRDLDRVLLSTPSGDYDFANCDRDKSTEVGRTRESACERIARYGVGGILRAGRGPGGARRRGVAQNEIGARGRICERRRGPPPALRAASGAGDEDPLVLSSRLGEALHAALRVPIKESGGEYEMTPQKKAARIAKKAANDYGGDVARVVDLERATGIYGSVDDLNVAISLLRADVRRGKLLILRCKNQLNRQGSSSGYRDIMLNVAVPESPQLAGELQLSLIRLEEAKKHVHTAYETKHMPEANGNDNELERVDEDPGFESEQTLCVVFHDGRSVINA